MLVAFPTFSGDIRQLKELLVWCSQLGEQKSHSALIVADSDTPFEQVKEAQKIGAQVFKEVKIVATSKSVKGWPQGSNALFRLAANTAKEPFLFLEPDSIPLKTGWMDSIQAEYLACGKKYLGHIYESNAPNLPTRLMSGIAVYPATAGKELPELPNTGRAWDVDYAEIMVSRGAHTNLIRHIWGMPNNAPRFAAKGVPGTSLFDLDSIPPEAVIFHRCKNGSLVRQLRRKMGIPDPLKTSTFVTVIPFCQKDASLALKNIKWQKELDGSKEFDCLLAYESNVNPNLTAQINSIAKVTYKTVFALKYHPAPIPNWPSGPNWGFQHVANHMQKLNRPWLFMEPDMFPLVPTWLDQLQEEYANCGHAFMGHVVKDFGHLQGTSIYPADLPSRCPKVMAATDVAFDTVSKDEMLSDCHASNELFAHIWGLNGDSPHHFVGNPIHFATADQVRKWIPPGAVTLHRCKDGSIADRLREMRAA